ncbi:MAG: LytTR family transcriptional regulator DNA-binding domain-containing protein [Roseibium sp.]|uniref:MHYT domain-containing protein n=1 Tax=Roseibium sp. TaxID=1936156 RepID=UPI00262935A7|nr:MHYT domain-containing protein [Roseibium sp.]MCV0429075.1 LytTR family transcriptional regulator DNA-binding domain-containing protein [Roseibium sp.]
MTVTHEPWLVALSLVMAFQGSFVGLSLAVQVRNAVEPRRRMLLAGAALTLALAIWSMHFVGMLAAKFPIGVDFLVLPTLLSFLVCVLVVGVAVFTASNRRLTSLRLGLAAFVMGAGICTMHYLGMYSLHDSLLMDHEPAYVLASFLIAFNAAGLALWLLFGLGKRPPLVVSAAVMGLAISAMHYTAMSGMTYSLSETAGRLAAPSLNPATLAIFVSCVAFLVSGLFLLTLVPVQQAEAGRDQETASHDGNVEETIDEAEPALQEAAASDPGKRTAAGLQAAPSSPRSSKPTAKRTLPIERDGQKTQIGIADIAAIHADAHYTKIYDGHREYFCPLSISEAEQQLDQKLFKRVHRSHIVNLSCVSSFKRAGDGGVLVLEGDDAQTVPVSRSRWSRIRDRLTTLTESADQQNHQAAAQ